MNAPIGTILPEKDFNPPFTPPPGKWETCDSRIIIINGKELRSPGLNGEYRIKTDEITEPNLM
jgi:hypothetical protein